MGPGGEKLLYLQADEHRPEAAVPLDEMDEMYERQGWGWR
jgi:hypothetical protein